MQKIEWNTPMANHAPPNFLVVESRSGISRATEGLHTIRVMVQSGEGALAQKDLVFLDRRRKENAP
jgi:hypothetical protein